MCAHTVCMWLHGFEMLSCPDLRMKTASSSSWLVAPRVFLEIPVLLSLCLDIIFESFHPGLGQDETAHHGAYHLESTSNGYLLCFR